MLQSKVSNTPKAEWICDFEATHDGHSAIMHEGELAIRCWVLLATQILNEDSSIQYSGEYMELQKAFYIIGKHQQACTDRMKVERLCTGF